MFLHDTNLINVFRDYGIMLPFAPDRSKRIMEEISKLPNFKFPIFDVEGALNFLGLERGLITPSDVELSHKKEYVDALFSGGESLVNHLLDAYELLDENGNANRYEIELATKPIEKMFQILLAQVEGTYIASLLSLKSDLGFSFYTNAGNHHARYDRGAGFCVLNDIIIASRKLQVQHLAKIIWIIDVDVHKGCGTAELVKFIRDGINPHGFENFCNIITLSIHMAKGWPLDSKTLSKACCGRAPLIESDIEIPLDEGCEDQYIALLKEGLESFVKVSGGCKADFAIVVDGADPYEHDGLESSSLIKLSLEQCLERDLLIYNFLQKNNVCSAWLMAGGYGERAYEVHANFLGAIGRK
ncbi:MAG: histone deacetylase [Termitinemataceae bacterium]|nr:MAG: histone deacetylase [Termitinemataceae bacterium]